MKIHESAYDQNVPIILNPTTQKSSMPSMRSGAIVRKGGEWYPYTGTLGWTFRPNYSPVAVLEVMNPMGTQLWVFQSVGKKKITKAESIFKAIIKSEHRELDSRHYLIITAEIKFSRPSGLVQGWTEYTVLWTPDENDFQMLDDIDLQVPGSQIRIDESDYSFESAAEGLASEPGQLDFLHGRFVVSNMGDKDLGGEEVQDILDALTIAALEELQKQVGCKSPAVLRLIPTITVHDTGTIIVDVTWPYRVQEG